MLRKRVDLDVPLVHLEVLGQRGPEDQPVAVDLLDARQLLVAAALGEVVDGEVVGGRARDVVG